MAKVSAPFLSLSASGKFAKTMVASVWKGLPYMRQYVIPANPKTVDQVAHRDLFTAAVLFWQTLKAVAIMKTAWGVEALMSVATQSGFNAFVQNNIWITKEDPDASFVTTYADTAGVPSWTMKNVDDGATGDEAGNFEVWRGTTKANLAFVENKTISEGIITGTIAPAAGVYYWKLIKPNTDPIPKRVSRGGIMVLTSTKP